MITPGLISDICHIAVEQKDIDKLYAVLKAHQGDLDEREAIRFRITQPVSFKVESGRYNGTIESIGRKGRIKIKLIGHPRYSQYKIGGLSLAEGIAAENEYVTRTSKLTK